MRLVMLFAALCLAACPRSSSAPAPGRTRLVFVHQPLWGDPAPFTALLDAFRRAHPEIELETQLLPNDSDVAHQYFLTSLEGGSANLDVFVADVVWVPEFARAGWIAELTDVFPLDDDFLPGARDAVTVDGKTWAVPWYLDVGLLYFRTDLVPHAPRTWDELTTFARTAMRARPGLQGLLWQGRQYEGLVCNVYEAIWASGGASLSGERLALDTPEANAGVQRLRGLIAEGLSPHSVLSAAEEESRRAFQDGRAVFMRNWPYAWAELQREGSAVRGKVGLAPLPTEDGTPGSGALGGWQLAVNASSSPERRKAAFELVRMLTSTEATVLLARAYGRNPPRRSAYGRLKGTEFEVLLPMLERARPRPVTPYYGLLTDVLQGEFSAAISGVRSPEEALRRAQRQADRLMGAANQ